MKTTATKNKLNPDQWGKLYSDHLFKHALNRTNDEELAKDIVQDTFLAGLKSAKNYKGIAAEFTWLVSIANNKIIDYYRKKNTIKQKNTIYASMLEGRDNDYNWLESQVADPTQKNDSKIDYFEFEYIIKRCISKLPYKQSLAIKMKGIQNMSTEVICEKLNISAPNLWVTLYRARKSLKKELQVFGLVH